MNVGLYQSAASLAALERWQDAVSQNITSSQVAGYKKQTVQVMAAPAGEIQADPAEKVGDGHGTATWLPRANFGVSFTKGESQPTNRDFDFAIGGAGFFQLKAADGNTYYTRNGSFVTTPENDLVSRQGYDVLGAGERPIKLQPGAGPISVDERGRITQNGAVVAQLEIVAFQNPHALISQGGGLFSAPPGLENETVEKPEILQGHLEQANIQPLREMVDLVGISRAYEANQKMISHRDELIKQTLEKLG